MRTWPSGYIWMNMLNFYLGASGAALTELAQLFENCLYSADRFFRWAKVAILLDQK